MTKIQVSIFFNFIFFFLLTISCSKESATPSASCSDGIQNGLESGIDCGGDCSTACISCADGIQNGSETGIDCGGDCSNECFTCDDGIQNGTETGVDCGGDCPTNCPTNISCAGATDSCMQATLRGLYWEALKFENVLENNELQIIGSTLLLDNPGTIILNFANPNVDSLPLIIDVKDINDELGTIITLETTGEIREHFVDEGTMTLLTFDSNNKSATGTFDIGGTGLDPFGRLVRVQAVNGQFSITWE